MLIITKSGRIYEYSPINNKIRLWERNVVCKDITSVSYIETFDYNLDKISMFTIEMTQQCNLRCKYCIYSGNYDNQRFHNNKFFQEDNIPQLVRFIDSHADKTAPVITICFYGGEALLQKPTIDKIIQNLHSLNYDFEYTISTNGVLLNQENIKWICSIPNLKVTVTVDGDNIVHDSNRVFPNGTGSFNTIMTNLQWFKKNYPIEYNNRIQFLSTIDSIDRLPHLSEFWQNNHLLSNHRPVHISSILPNFPKDIFTRDTALKNQIVVYNKAYKAYINNEDNILTDELKRLIGIIEYRDFNILPKQQRFVTCCHNPYSCFISSTGSLFICEKFNLNNEVGNIYSGFNIDSLRRIISVFTERKNSLCSKCWARRLCRICATNVNHTLQEFDFFCNRERQKIQLALKYYCEIQEFNHSYRNTSIEPV